MKRLIFCAYNMDNCCVELKFIDGSMIAIDTIAVENEVADNMYQRSELDYLIYNDPIAYADLVLNGDPEAYLKAVTEYKPIDRPDRSGIRAFGGSDTTSFLPSVEIIDLFILIMYNIVRIASFTSFPMSIAKIRKISKYF